MNYSNKRTNYLTMIVTLSSVMLCICAVLGLNFQTLHLLINQQQWQDSKPTTYYMQVTESRPDGLWRWATYVQQSYPVTVTLLSQPDKHLERESWLAPADMTVEQIFSSAKQFCASRKIWDCWLEFDSQFHYPKQVESYQLIIIKVEKFTPCGQTVASCSVKPDFLP